jgi:predicted kinase
MPKIFIAIGISGSGKSTFFKTMCSNASYLNADTIRGELCNGDLSDQSKNREVFETLYSKFATLLSDGYEADCERDIVVDNTTLTLSDRNKYYTILEASEYKSSWELVLVYFRPNLMKAITWNCNRERQVPLEVIYKQFNKIQAPQTEELAKYKSISVELGY